MIVKPASCVIPFFAGLFDVRSVCLKTRLKALQLPPPIKVDETRNSILLVGIGGVGKTSLIKALTHDSADCRKKNR
jgi:predicted GTPase